MATHLAPLRVAAPLRIAAPLCVVVALALTGCGDDTVAPSALDTQASPDSNGTDSALKATTTGADATPETTTDSDPAQTEPRAVSETAGDAAVDGSEEEDVSVYFAVEGGIANLVRSVELRADGSLTGERSGQAFEGRIEADRFEAIEAALAASGLFDHDREYPPPAGAADLQRYEIRYRGVTVVAHDTTVPPELADVVSQLDQLTATQ